MDREETELETATVSPMGDVSPEPIPIAAASAVFGAAVTSHPKVQHEISVGVGAKAPAKLDRRYVTAALMLVMVLASMEQTITSTAMPTIIGKLHGLQHYSWVASVYLLACTVSMPLYGRLSDALGRKRVILFAIGLFLVGSLLASSARSMPELILYRGLQGLGAGGIMPVVLTILGDIFTLQERAKIQGFFSSVWGTSSLAGPALGAFLVNTLGWRSVFFVNLPFGIVAAIVLAWKYHDLEKPHSTDLDLPGAVSLAIGCTALLTLVSGMGPQGWSGLNLAMLGVITGLALAYFVRHELKAPAPIMPPKLLRKRNIGPSMIASLLMGICFLSLDTYVPLYVQGARGGGAGAAASVVTPVMLTWALSGIIAAPLVVGWGFRRTAMMGSILVVIGFTGLLVGAIDQWPRWTLTLTLAITGLGLGPLAMSYLLAAQDAVTWQHRGVITSSVQFFRTMGGAMGIGLLGALFNLLMRPEMHRLKAMGISTAALLDPQTRSTLPDTVILAASHAIGSGLIWVFAAMLAIAILEIGVSSLLPKHKSQHAIKPSEAIEAMAG